MRIWTLAVALLLALAVSDPAFAATKLDRWAQRHDLRGEWRAKDADRDGVKNRQEYTLRLHPRRADSDRDGLRDGDELRIATDPRRADSDGDGTRDGDENAGVVSAFDGTFLTVRRFGGGELHAVVDDGSECAGSDADESFVEVEEIDDPGPAEEPEMPADDEEPVLDLGGDDDYGYGGCADPRIRPGAVVSSIELADRDGELTAIAINFAPVR